MSIVVAFFLGLVIGAVLGILVTVARTMPKP